MAATRNRKLTLLITGGSGYVASIFLKKYFSSQLLELNPKIHFFSRISSIILIDKLPLCFNAETWTVPVYFHQVDLLDSEKLSAVFKDVDVVFHMASYGMSGREQLHADIIWKVNVEGTRNVISACKMNNVKALIFTSTVNVVFGGQKIEGGDESLPYFDEKQRPWDNYGNSKALAEKHVLQANGTITADGGTRMNTCSLRLCGIYGPGERRHLSRVVGSMKKGLFKVTYGSNPIVEFVHAENVAKALLLAADQLLKPAKSKAAGEAYFISDGAPINNFEFFRPLTEALDVSFPKLSLPLWMVFFLAHVIEIVYSMVHRIYDFQPLLCRAEVYKTGQTHYFSIEKARRDLNYEPDYENDMKEIAKSYGMISQQETNNNPSKSPFINILVNISLFIIAIMFFMSFLPTVS